MKNLFQIITILLCLIPALCVGEVKIVKNVGRNFLSVHGKPMLILGGELGNSAVTSPKDIHVNIEKIAGKGLNTLLVPAYWDLLEPREGIFDFSLVDTIIDQAKEKDIKVVILWFGAWKNSMSCYAPEWVKKDTGRYPRAYTETGKPMEILSVFSDEVYNSDSKAFKKLLRHIREYDRDNTVIMVQVENEIGMLESPRDFSGLANAEYDKGVPEKLIQYLCSNLNSLHPSLLEKWKNNGMKTSGSWKDIFGEDIYTDEYFMAWNYGKYIEKLVEEGNEIIAIPFYLNAAMNSRERKPGEYPSAGPLPHLKDIWMAAAPSVDFISPDIYDSGFEKWVDCYDFDGNTVFVPEVKRDLNNPAQTYYVIGHHNALGISPFAIENGDEEYFDKLSRAYETLHELLPLLSDSKYFQWIDGVLLTAENPTTVINDDSVKISLSHYFTLPWDSRAAFKDNWNDAGAILIKISPDEYLLAGTGVVVKFEHEKEISQSQSLGEDGFVSTGNQNVKIKKIDNTPRIGILSVEEVNINPDGTLSRIRSFNGDETHQGRHARISVDDNKILHIKTYKYE